MKLRNIFTVYLKELKDTLRDRRSLLSIVIIPTFLMPALFFGVFKISARIVSKAKEEIPSVMIIGGADSPAVVTRLKADKKIRVVPLEADWKQQISDKRVRAAVEIPAGFEAGLAAGQGSTVTIYNYTGEIKSGFAVTELEDFFRDLRDRTITERLTAKSLPATLIKPFEMQRQNVAAPEKVGGNLFGGVVPYLIIILCFTGAMYPAMDLTAGEKERGTMETLLCSPVARGEIVMGKFLMVLTGSLSAMILALTSMGLSATGAGAMFAGSGGARLAAATASAKAATGVLPTIDLFGVFGVLAMVLPVAVLFSALLFTVALFAKSYKEAQSYVGPMVFLVIMPAVVGMLPGIDLNARLALVPILNLSLVCKEMLSGVWHWNYIGLIFGSSCVYAAIALALAVKMFSRESVIFRA